MREEAASDLGLETCVVAGQLLKDYHHSLAALKAETVPGSTHR